MSSFFEQHIAIEEDVLATPETYSSIPRTVGKIKSGGKR
jgi:hypothetical protein